MKNNEKEKIKVLIGDLTNNSLSKYKLNNITKNFINIITKFNKK